MWRLGVLLVATALVEFAAADVKRADNLLIQRLKRSPNTCDDYGYTPPSPPPPRPRFWPPHPPPPPFWPPPHHHHRFEDFTDALSRGEEPCSTCGGKNGSASALSNAKSENGDAIAVAISKGGPK